MQRAAKDAQDDDKKTRTLVRAMRRVDRDIVVTNGKFELPSRSRLIMFANTDVSAEEVLGMDASDITVELLIQNHVKANTLVAAGVGPRILKPMGVTEAAMLRTLGFDALHLADSKFAAEAISVYGAEQVRAAFLTGASDAVSLSGSDALAMLNITVNELLECCAGAATEACAVLEQLPLAVSLAGVSPKTLLDTGLRKVKLSQLGYSLSSVVDQTGATAQHLQKLGYGLSSR